LPIIGAVCEGASQDILVTAAERYSVLRRFSPRFLAAFRFESNVPQDPVLAAGELLKTMDRNGTRTRLTVACTKSPCSFTLRDRLRGSDIWVAGSREYRAFEDYLLPGEAARNVGIGQETDANRFVEGRAAALHERLSWRDPAQWHAAAGARLGWGEVKGPVAGGVPATTCRRRSMLIWPNTMPTPNPSSGLNPPKPFSPNSTAALYHPFKSVN